jgi:hypothetical protein
VQEPLLLVTIQITRKQVQEQQQYFTDHIGQSPVIPGRYNSNSLSGRHRVMLLSGLAKLAGVSRLAVGLTTVKMQQQQQQQQQGPCALAAAAGVASLKCTVSDIRLPGCYSGSCICLDRVFGFCICFSDRIVSSSTITKNNNN